VQRPNRKSKNGTAKLFHTYDAHYSPERKAAGKKTMWKWSGLLCLHKFALSISHSPRLMSNCLCCTRVPCYICEKYAFVRIWCVCTIRLSAGVFSACFHSATQSPAIQDRDREHVGGPLQTKINMNTVFAKWLGKHLRPMSTF
jgi:hypothetical protein